MNHYCRFCGAQLRENACYCQHCGAPVDGPRSFCRDAAPHLFRSAQTAAKIFAILLLGGGSVACGMIAFSLLGISAGFLYQYATGSTVFLPWLVCHNLQGTSLLIIGLMAAFITVLFTAITATLAQGVRELTK